MRLAAKAPVGHLPSEVTLHSKLHASMPMMVVVKLTRRLGRKLRDEPESFALTDTSVVEVEIEIEIEFGAGRCRSWRLERGKPT